MGALPGEVTKEHTRILRLMLATEDCASYWKAPLTEATGSDRLRQAFNERWFGNKTEARVKTLLGDMALRFDAYPAALHALRLWLPPRALAPWICHIHTQLADPIYRQFTGSFLPKRRQLGYATVDREIVARWMQEQWSGRWSASTCLKFGSNMLATAFEAGVLKERKDPRKLALPRPPRQVLEYLLYLLREVEFDGGIVSSPYLASLIPEPADVERSLRSLESVRFQSIGDIVNFEWSHPNLYTWAEAQAGVLQREALA